MEGTAPDVAGGTPVRDPNGGGISFTNGGSDPFPKKQYGVAVDLLSAGEIHGIVGGLNGVYLNGAEVVEEEKWQTVRPTVATGHNTGSALTFTTDQTIPSDTALPQFGIVRGGMGSFTTTASASIGERRLTFGSNAFTSIQSTHSGAMGLRHVQLLARIVLSSGDYWAPIRYVQSTSDSTPNYITFTTPLRMAVPSGTTVHVDWGGRVTSITSNSITFNNTSLPSLDPITFSSSNKTNIRLLGGVNTPAASDVKNFKETFVDYRKGSRFQQGPEGIGSAPAISFVLGRNDDLGMYSGIDNVPGTLSTTAETIIHDTDFQFGQSTLEEIDMFQVDIEFPGGLFAVSENGTQYDAFVDFQVIFEYMNNDEQSSFESILVAGKDYGGSDFVDGLGYPSGAQRFRNDLIPRHKFSHERMAARSSSAYVRARAQRTKFIKSIFFDVTRYQPFTDWRIKVRRLVPSDPTEWWTDNNSAVAQCKSVLKTVTAAAKERLMYPMSAYAVVGFSAQDFPTPPKRSYKIKGKKIKVPTNYFTRDERRNIEAKYTRNKSTGADASSYVTWDGTFRGDPSLNPSSVNYHKVYCNNPAWIFYDILTDKEIGLGEFINESDIDIYGLYQIARYCDELVPDGKGGQEPRFTCNVYFSKKKEAYKVLKDLASTFRSMMYWIDGKVSLIQDKPKEAVYTFTTGNVKDGMFNYTYTGDKARTNQVRVAWNNPKETYKQTVLTVDDLPNIAQQGKIIAKDVVAFGCTSESQARRVGLWHLETDTRETELVTFNTGLNAAYLRPGDIIKVQDKRQNNIIASGRVSTGSTSTSIVLDRTVTFPGGTNGTDCNLYLIYDDPGIYLQEETATINSTTYSRGELIQTKADGTNILTGATQEDAANFVDDSGNVLNVQFAKNSRVEVEAITNTGSSASTITTAAFAGGAPAQDTIWAISREDDVSTEDIKEYRIAGISEIESNEYEITATQYTREKFDEIDVDRPVVTDNFVEVSTRRGTIPAPQEIILTTGHDATLDAITAEVSWDTPTESFTDSAGTTETIPYRFLQGYIISHNFSGSNASDSGRGYGAPLTESVYVPATSNSHTFYPRTAGTYTISIRTVNDVSETSRELVRTVTVTEQGEGFASRVSEYQNITALAGTLTHSSGTITASDLVDISTRRGFYTGITGGDFDFTSMGNSAEAFLFFDGSPLSPSLKRTLLHVDSTTDCNERNAYLKEIGASNNGLSSITGQIDTITEGSARVLGNASTTFTSDFSEGDLIKFSTNSAPGTEVAASEYRVVTRIESDRVLYVDLGFQDRGNSLLSASNIYAFKQTLGPNRSEDALVARLTTDAGGTYTFEDFVVPTTRNSTRNTGALADLSSVSLESEGDGGVTGTLAVDHGGTGYTDDRITNFDDASALGFNPAFSNWSSGVPVGWDVWNGGSSISEETTSVLTGNSSIKMEVSSAAVGLRRSARYHSPTVQIRFPLNSVVIGSYDAYIDSGATGNRCGILVDLRDADNHYHRKAIPVTDATETGVWQRMYFKVSANDNTHANQGGTVDGEYHDIQIYLMGNWQSNTIGTTDFNGTIYFDNLRFQVVTPSIDNREVNYASDGTGTLPAGSGGTGITDFSTSDYANINVDYANDGTGELPVSNASPGLRNSPSGTNMVQIGTDTFSTSFDNTFLNARMSYGGGAGSYSFSTADPVFDGQNLLFTSDGTADYIFWASGPSAGDYNLPLKSSQKYIVSMWAKFSAIPSSYFRARLRVQDGAYASGDFDLTGVSTDTWTRISTVITTPSDATDGNLSVWCHSTSSPTIHIDGVMLEEYNGEETSPSPSTFIRSGDPSLYGATLGSNFFDSGGTVQNDSDVQNSAVSVGADGTLSGAGGGQVTLYGLDAPSGPTGGGFHLDPSFLHANNWNTGSAAIGCSRSESGSPDGSPMYSVNGTTKGTGAGSFCQSRLPPYITAGNINSTKVMEMEPQIGSSYYCKLLMRVTTGWTSACALPKLALKDTEGLPIGTGGSIDVVSDDGSESYTGGDYPEFFFLRSNGSYTDRADQIAIDAGAGNWVWAVGKMVVEGGTLGNIKYAQPYFHLDTTNPGGGTFEVAYFQVYDHDPEGVSPAQAGRNLVDHRGTVIPSVSPTSLYDDFSYNSVQRFTSRWSAAQDIGGEETIVIDTSSPQGAHVLQLGNNSGDDEVWRSLPMAEAIPIEENAIYKIRALAARTAGSGTIYFGINGVNAAKTHWVNSSGTEHETSMSSSHYIAASNHSPADTNYHEYIGYFYRDSTSGSSFGGTNSNTLISPARIHYKCEHAVPMFIANYDNDPGIVRIAFIELEKVVGFGADSQVFLNSEFDFGSDGTGTLPSTAGGTGITNFSNSTHLNANTTASQVGLGNVVNVDTTNAANITSGTLPAGRGGTGITNFSNSTHLNANTTASQVGLGNVANERQITIFRQSGTPTALAVGDLWVDTGNGNRLYRAGATGTGSWTIVGAGTSAANITAGTLPTTRGGTGTTDSSTFLNNDIAVSLVVDKPVTTWVTNDSGASYIPNTTTEDIIVSAISNGADSMTVRWTRTAGNVTGCAEQSGSTGAFTLSSFGSAATSKTITVTHTASSETITISASVVDLSVSGGGK